MEVDVLGYVWYYIGEVVVVVGIGGGGFYYLFGDWID